MDVLDERAAVEALRDVIVADDPAVANAAFEYEVMLRTEEVAQHRADAGERVDAGRIAFDAELAAHLLLRRIDDHDAHRDFARQRSRHERAIGGDLLRREHAAKFGPLREMRDIGIREHVDRSERAGIE